jgi:hypothetical protein
VSKGGATLLLRNPADHLSQIGGALHLSKLVLKPPMVSTFKA